MEDKLGLQITGQLTVIVKDKHGRVLYTIDGPNAVMTRAKFILSRLLGGNAKQFPSGTFSTPPKDWPNVGDNYPESLIYPVSNNQGVVEPSSSSFSIEEGFAFGGVTNDVDLMLGVSGGGNLVGKQNIDYATEGGCAYHRGQDGIGGGFDGSGATDWTADGDVLYDLNITGMAFGNGGHLMFANGGTQGGGSPPVSAQYPSSTPTRDGETDEGYFPRDTTDNSKIVCENNDTFDVYGKPAQPGPTSENITIGNVGYNLVYTDDPNIPGTVYEQVENGIVPPSAAATGDNWVGVQDPNTTLYSETVRYPLDPVDGISYPDYKSVKFKCTVPADSEANQQREFGYSRRPRNIITEAGLITGENILVQSPDPRCKADGAAWADSTSVPDTTAIGLSNINGGQLGYILNPGTVSGGWWSGANYNSLPKDYFTRVRDINQINQYMFNPVSNPTEYSRLYEGNNTWNLFARRVFGALTKTPEFEFIFVWTITF